MMEWGWNCSARAKTDVAEFSIKAATKKIAWR